MLSYQTPARIASANAEADRIMLERKARGMDVDHALSPAQARDFQEALSKRKAG